MIANTGVMVINPAIYPKLPYQTLKDLHADCPYSHAAVGPAGEQGCARQDAA